MNLERRKSLMINTQISFDTGKIPNDNWWQLNENTITRTTTKLGTKNSDLGIHFPLKDRDRLEKNAVYEFSLTITTPKSLQFEAYFSHDNDRKQRLWLAKKHVQSGKSTLSWFINTHNFCLNQLTLSAWSFFVPETTFQIENLALKKINAPTQFQGQKILVTHSILQNLNGSAINTLELVDCLQKIGMQVDVLAAASGAPLQQAFEDLGIPIVTNSKRIHPITAYDFAWIHHQILPLLWIDSLKRQIAGIPKFIFNHMGAISYIAPDEFPMLYGIESKLSSVSTYVSENCMNAQEPHYLGKLPTKRMLYPNPVPDSFSNFSFERHTTLQKIAIVSNHTPIEIRKAKSLLEAAGIQVDIVGKKGTIQELVSPRLLANYDVIVTIGKTVQYGLAMGIPVFNYDHFGGIGYLNDENFEKAAKYNFTGRTVGEKYSAEMIAEKIIADYHTALSWIKENRDHLIVRYNITNTIINILTAAKNTSHSIPPFEENYAEVIKANLYFTYRHWRYLSELTILREAK